MIEKTIDLSDDSSHGDETFTEYVRVALDGEPSASRLDDVFTKLGDALKHEMLRRGLWTAPPSYLGIFGGQSWQQAETFEELLTDCYLFNFVKRLAGLGALLAAQDNIEGVVFRNIRQFLFEKQRRYDPVGYRVFKVLRQAVRRSLDHGELMLLAAGPPIVNRTLLGWSRPEADAPPPADALQEATRRWTDLLMPELVTSREPRLSQVVAELCRHLRELGIDVDHFRFKDLIDPFKGYVRRRWSALWAETQGETALDRDGDGPRWVRLLRPNPGFERRDRFEELLKTVDRALEGLDTDAVTRDYLRRLWIFMRGWAAEPDAERLPSRRRIAELLAIPRYRLPSLYATLGDLTSAYRNGDPS